MPPSKKAQSRPEAKVTRDPTFGRAVADKVLTIDLGRDLELSFLQAAPTINKVVDWDEVSEKVELGGGLAEVARIRMSPPVALGMAINLISTLVDAGKVKVPALRDAILQIAADHDASEDAVQE